MEGENRAHGITFHGAHLIIRGFFLKRRKARNTEWLQYRKMAACSPGQKVSLTIDFFFLGTGKYKRTVIAEGRKKLFL